MELRELLLLKATHGGGGGTLVEKETTGNPAVFTTRVSKQVISIVIPMPLSQSGSGDPSPDNIRAIAGYSSVSVLHNGKTCSIDFPSGTVVYTGSLDAISGELTITHAGYETTWGACTNPSVKGTVERRKVTLPFVCIDATSPSNGAACNVAPWKWDYSSDDVHFYNNQSSSYVFLPIGTADSTEIQIVGKLAVPVTIRLAANEISTVVGENTIQTNTAGVNTIVYYDKE